MTLSKMYPEKRKLNWPNCHNARDLGGLPLPDGTQTRWQAIVRSDLPARLTAAGQQALLDYGIRTIIDLRRPNEVIEHPTEFGRNAFTEYGLTILNIPAERTDPAFRRSTKAAATRADLYCGALQWMATENAAAIKAIAHARPGGILIHCHAGKDRTGITAALLLSVVGVAAADIAADYALTQKNLWPLYAKWVAEVGDEAEIDPWYKPITAPETMLATLDFLDKQYGGAAGYLLQAGVCESELRLLRQRLTTN
ncbi:MAG: tyrosine-protein phosphatase [Anaerolineae bacterium]|nr:tyrosine-protein phosphatase [Anaerolineae bacterium]